MTTIIVSTTYTLNIEDLRDIELRGRECIKSRIDNIRIFLNALIDDILVHHDYLKTEVTCYYDYKTFSISLKDSYPFIKKTREPVLFKFDCEIENITNAVISEVVDNCVIDNGDPFNNQLALKNKAIDVIETPYFFQAIQIIDNVFIFDGELLKKLKRHPFDPYQKNSFIHSIFNIECGGEMTLQAIFGFGPFYLYVHGSNIHLSYSDRVFSFHVSIMKLEEDVKCLKDVFNVFYSNYSGEPIYSSHEDLITLLKMKYI